MSSLSSSLVLRTKLPQPLQHKGWRAKAYPAAGEAVLYLAASGERKEKPKESTGGDPQKNRARAARRSKGQVRRFSKANGLNRLWTLTYAEGQFDRHRVAQDVRRFLEDLQERFGRMPLLLVLEWHPGGHGLHIHMLADRYLYQPTVQAIWGRGWVHGKRLKALKGHKRGAVAAAAAYAAKYVGKDDADDRPAGAHRYYVTQGWQPEEVHTIGTPDTLQKVLGEMMGGAPVYIWSSAEAEDWEGPPTAFIMWAT